MPVRIFMQMVQTELDSLATYNHPRDRDHPHVLRAMLHALDSHMREYHSPMEPAAPPQMPTSYGARDSQVPSDQDLYTARDKLTAVAPKCEKA
eukprot:244016-Pleurochrysis_carterae.AAC.1